MVRPSAPLSLQLPEPDPGLHRLLTGGGKSPESSPGDPARQWNRSLPARTRQPHRVG